MRYLITGGSGYVGSGLVAALARRPDTEAILVADIRPPKVRPPKTGFRRLDIRDSAATLELIDGEQPDVLVHLAWAVDPLPDESDMYEVDVNGTFNVLASGSAAGTDQILVLSSTLAYGPWPDNPVPILEQQPVHGHSRYIFARHSTEADRIAQLWATLHPERVMTIVRSALVSGPGVDNHLSRMWSSQPFFPDFGGVDHPTQFIHQDDLTDALLGLLEGRHAGVFNAAGEGTLTWQTCAELAGLQVRRVREDSFTSFAAGLWRAGAGADVPPSFIDFFKHPWIASNDKLKRTLGWSPRYSSKQAFEAMLAARKNPQPVP